MKILLERKYKKDSYTIGRLSITPPFGGWGADTLEPPLGNATETITAGSGKAIPKGTYNVRMAWSQRFQEFMPRLVGVPGRSGILIHAGNTPRDTVGCILVGRNTQKGRVVDSRKTLSVLIELIREALKSGEKITIEIK